MCDHKSGKKIYRNISYCKKCNLVLGSIYRVGRIRRIKHKNPIDEVSVLDFLEDGMKLKIKTEKTVEKIII